MGIGTKQLEAIFQEINEHFADNRYITVEPLEGEPPDKYEITYHIKGLHQNKKKEVIESSHHSIVISIPFGFPHFPPNCKPISPIYHPDFDQAAICIGDFWKKESTLSELIFHIGRMIYGKVFSVVNAFNEEAVIWYKQHHDSLPFEPVDIFLESERQQASSPRTDTFSDLETLEINTLHELEPELEIIPPEEEPPAPAEMSSLQTATGFDTDLLKLMAKQKRFYSLYSLSQTIPEDNLTPLIQDLQNKAKEVLTRAKQIFQQGLDLEQQNHPDKAFEKFNLLSEMISDYPDLQEALIRTQVSADALKSYQPSPVRQKSSENTVIGSDIAAEQQNQLTFFTQKPRIHAPILPIIIASAALILVVLAAFFLYSTNSQYKRAKTAYSSCKALLEAEKFKEAESQCNLALSMVSDIHLLKGQEKISLSNDIQTTLSSQKLRQGLAGMILVNGRFIPKEEKKALTAFVKAMEQGDAFVSNQSWQKAKQHYQRALDIAERVQSVRVDDPAKVVQVRKDLALTQAHLFFEEGKKSYESGKIADAIVKLEKAAEEAKSLDDTQKNPLLQAISPLLSQAKFSSLKKEGDAAFAKQDWQQAKTLYIQAIDFGKISQHIPPSELSALSELKLKATLYATIEQGKNAFDKSQWDHAIQLYESAIDLLKENGALLKQESSEENRKKLSRIMLQASVIRDNQDVARLLKDQKSKQAISKLQATLETVKKSPFSREEYFQQIIKEINLRIAEVQNNQLISQGIDYLTNNYKDIVKKNYPVTKLSLLTDPKAIFVKKMGEKLLYKLECVDRGQGNPLRVIMFYTYDTSNKKWEFYSNAQ